MIKQGDRITNARTGQTMVFVRTGAETNGEVLEIECFSPPTTAREPEHIHPLQANIFKMIEGSCVFSIDGKEKIAGPGETIHIPPNTKHHFWNSGDTVAHYMQEFRPALHIDGFFETFFALSRDGKLNAQGIPGMLQMALIGLEHKDEIRVTQPPWVFQLILFYSLAPVARLLGYRSAYVSGK